MGLMSFLFGKGPDLAQDEKKQTNIIDNSSESGPHLAEEMDEQLKQRIHNVIIKIREHMTPDNKSGHNSIVNSDIYKIEFAGVNQDTCYITFNDRTDNDDFEVEGDMDHDTGTAHDVYAVKIHPSGSFIVERGHPDENGILHFRPVQHTQTQQMISFVEGCMNIDNSKIININSVSSSAQLAA